MNNSLKFNVVVIGVSCFDGMASSMRVRNLLETVVFEDSLTLHNLVYKVDAHGLQKKKGKLNGINYVVVKASSFLSIFSSTWQGIRFLKQCKSKERKNIVYNYQYIDIKNVILLFFAKALGYKIIFDIVEDNKYYTSFAGLKNRLKIATSIKLLRLTPWFANYVITISHHLQNVMTAVCEDKTQVSIVPITVDFNRFKKLNRTIPSIYKIFYGGSFGLKDGMEYLITTFGKIAEKYNNVQLIMTGRASEEDFKTLQKYLGNSDAKNKINHLGFLDNDAYYETLNSCHIFCMTRTNSKFAGAGFPFKLGEFLATGKAVIATKVGDVPKYLENGKNALLIKPESFVELEEALSYLIDNPEEINAIGEKGRVVAMQNFDTLYWSKEFKRIFDII